ncbi:MAG: Trm112 family protein [Fibrobacterota bacterium]
MIARDLLDLLVCPETRTPLRVADNALITALNKKIAGNALKNRAGERVTEPFDGGLVREDGKVLYPVRKDIPIMLTDESIALS